jgi:hypothetical protein
MLDQQDDAEVIRYAVLIAEYRLLAEPTGSLRQGRLERRLIALRSRLRELEAGPSHPPSRSGA